MIAVDGGGKLDLRELRDEELLHRGLRGEVFHHELIRAEIREFVAALEVPRILDVIEMRVEDLFRKRERTVKSLPHSGEPRREILIERADVLDIPDRMLNVDVLRRCGSDRGRCAIHTHRGGGKT